MKIWTQREKQPTLSEIAGFSNILQQSLVRARNRDDCQDMLHGRRSLQETINCLSKIEAKRVDLLGEVSDKMTELAQQFVSKSCKAIVGGKRALLSGPSDHDTNIGLWTVAMEKCWEVDRDKMVLFTYSHQYPYPDGRLDVCCEESSQGLSIFHTIGGITGLAPKGVKPGDELWQLETTEDNTTWRIVRGSQMSDCQMSDCQMFDYQIMSRAVITPTVRLQYECDRKCFCGKCDRKSSMAITSLEKQFGQNNIHRQPLLKPSHANTAAVITRLDELYSSRYIELLPQTNAI